MKITNCEIHLLHGTTPLKEYVENAGLFKSVTNKIMTSFVEPETIAGKQCGRALVRSGKENGGCTFMLIGKQ